MNQETHRRLERFIGRTLQFGVILAAMLGLAGGCLFLLHHGSDQPQYNVFQGTDSTLRSPSAIVESAARGEENALIMLGLLVLIATPIARVLLSAALFAVERDAVYVAITLVVLAILAWSLLGQ